MKLQVTKKAVMKSYSLIIRVGYHGLQNLLWYEERRAYTAGVNGWNADVYEFGGTAIVTGYRPFGDPVSRELIEKYESAAKEVFDGGLPYEEEKEKLRALAREFVREAIKEAK